MTTLDVTAPATRLKGWDSLEFYVGNARAMAGFLTAAFGFEVTAYAGPETAATDIASYLLEQGDIRFVVTVGLTPDSPIWTHVREHGDGAQDLAFVVDDATATYEAAIARGAWFGAASPTNSPTNTARCASRPSAPTERPSTPSSTAATTRLLLPRLRHHRLAARPVGRPTGGARPHRPRRRQRRGRQARRVGRVLRGRDGLPSTSPLRRAPDRHRIQRARDRP